MRRILLKISGHVQGVGFRALARSIARSLQITGWARNEPDGSVLILAQGQEGSLRLFEKRIASIKHGPSGPHVSAIEGQNQPQARGSSHSDFLIS